MNNRSTKSDDFFARVREIGKLTRTESMIVTFFEANINLLAFENLTALSQKAGVGKASMVRFIKHRLGYDDFAQFQDERREFMEQRLDSPVRRYVRDQAMTAKSADKQQSAFERHFPEALHHLQLVFENMDPGQIEEVAKYMTRKNSSIFLLGQRTSYSLAHTLYVKLLYVRPNIYLVGGPDSTLPHQIFNASEGDIVFVIHRKRYSQNTYDIAKQLKTKGLDLVLMTDSEVSPLASMADRQIVIPSSKRKDYLGDSAWVAVLESIFLAVADICQAQNSEYTEMVEKSLQKFFGIRNTS